MRPRTLTTQRLYFGVDAFKLREATSKVLSRVVGLGPERARVRAEDIQHDFGVDTIEGATMVEEMVAEGLLAPRREGGEYQLTDRFREYANARVVEPLSRSRARAIVASARQLADRINTDWMRNPLEVAALAPFGSYLSQDPTLESLPLGIVVRMRPATRRARWRMLTKADGAHEIRGAFKALSSFVHAQLLMDVSELPTPFAVVYQALEDDVGSP
ncbi:MAG TPA: hypothetical protein VNG69_15825 [Casimicrobiaceae bacterium]|nr:hypothetical protein [Casimicrobiaceae bacterium]